MQDVLRPDDEASARMYATAYQTWLQLRDRAIATPLELASSSTSMASAFPNHPRLIPQLELARSSPCVLYATGLTVWETASNNKCDLPSFTVKTSLQVTGPCATPVVLEDGSSTTPWARFGERGDHVPILALAWAYVLSARWAEIIPGASMEYSDSRAPSFPASQEAHGRAHNHGHAISVQVGDVTDAALRWWEAVLAPGEGWDASVRHNDQSLKSPWSVSLTSPGIVIVANNKPGSLGNHVAASYTVATAYILAYAAYHGVYKQSGAAFAAALLLPTRRLTSKSVRWARPRLPGKHRPQHARDHGEPPWGGSEQQLDKLLTASCNTTGMQAVLTSSFIEPDIPCNICGAWLQGTFAVLDDPSAQPPAVLAHMLMRKSPHLDFLWLGAILTGVEHHITKWARAALCFIDLQAAAWTSSFISFIQRPVSVAPATGRISRADEARLLFLAHEKHHGFPPLVPFTPFGFTALADCALDVQLHARCAGDHGLRYAGMSWDCGDGAAAFQSRAADSWPGAQPLRGVAVDGVSASHAKFDRDRDVSESMTRSMFEWLWGVDGYPVAERAIREHEWIAHDLSSDEDGDVQEGEGGSTVGNNVGRWLSKGVTARSYTL